MEVGAVNQDDCGLWRASVWPGHADELLAAIDPDAGFVLVETWDGNPDWHEAVVSVGSGEEPRTRILRHHRFDLLITPAEAVEIGAHLRAQGIAGGGLGCYQLDRRPSATFRLPAQRRARADAMRGQGVELQIDLPHDGETAVVWAPSEATIERYTGRLR